MKLVSAQYRFDRPENLVSGIGRSSRPSTDSLNVLHRWRVAHAGRDFTVLHDADDHLLAEVIWLDDDIRVGESLDMLCSQHGLERHFTG